MPRSDKDWYELACTVTAYSGLFAIGAGLVSVGGLFLLGLYAIARGVLH